MVYDFILIKILSGELIAQEDCLQEHQHSFPLYDRGINSWRPIGPTGDFKATVTTSSPIGARVGNETRPINFTFKLWLRTA